MKINRYQRILLDTYAGGAYKHAAISSDLDGDGLVDFLFDELSDDSVENMDQVSARLGRARAELVEVCGALADATLKGLK